MKLNVQLILLTLSIWWPYGKVTNPSGVIKGRAIGYGMCRWDDGSVGACDDWYDPSRPWETWYWLTLTQCPIPAQFHRAKAP